MEQWGSFVVQGIPAIGLLLAGRYRRAGWLVCLLGQAGAVAFGCLTGLLGYFALAPVYITIYTINWISWSKRKERRSDAPADARGCDGSHYQRTP
jgi:hypothetical protein